MIQRTNTSLLKWTGLFVIAVPLLLTGCSEDDENNNQGPDMSETATVEAVEYRVGTLPLVHRTTGEMRAGNQVDIYPEISARIIDVKVNDGDRVSEGDTLVKFRDDQVREQLNQAKHDYEIAGAELRQAEANLQRLEAQYERVRELQELDLETALELETLEADKNSAEASVDLSRSQMLRAESQIEEQRSNLENTVVRSPVDGVVGGRDAETGQQVDGSHRLFRVGDIDNMRIHVMLTEAMSGQIEPGNRAELISGVGINPVEATVERISPFLDPVTHTTTAQLQVAEGSQNLRPGMFVTVDIFYGETEETTLVPKAAIYEHPIEGETGIFVADMSGIEREFELEGEEGSDEREVTPNPVPVQFIPVEVKAESRGMAGIDALDDPDMMVVTIGQNQLAEFDYEQAFVRQVGWDHVISLQNLQARDMESIIFGDNDQ